MVNARITPEPIPEVYMTIDGYPVQVPSPSAPPFVSWLFHVDGTRIDREHNTLTITRQGTLIIGEEADRYRVWYWRAVGVPQD